MLDTYPIRTSDLPEDQRFLLEDYPRDSWQFHPGFKERTRHWLGAHKMFRRLGKQVRTDVELFLDTEHDP